MLSDRIKENEFRKKIKYGTHKWKITGIFGDWKDRIIITKNGYIIEENLSSNNEYLGKGAWNILRFYYNNNRLEEINI